MNMYFYDLETSGISPRASRIMQFAGQRTDMNLKPVGKPDNFLVKITPDILPDPEAVLVHGISPQKTLAEGITEAELAKYLIGQVFLPGTVVVGFNNIRFDDEFIRFLFWRNFTDAYEWQWKDGRSRWDILDASRMARALRPEGIEWPFSPDGKPTNRLESLAAVNNLEHDSAHDALSDVWASIAVARLLYSKQQKLFEYLLTIRDKNKVAALVNRNEPFLYTSGRYSGDYERTTVAVCVAPHPGRAAALVYDLRVEPAEFTGLSVAELAAVWQQRGKDAPYFPIKVLSYNKCPAVAPLSVLDSAASARLKIDSAQIDKNLTVLKKAKDFGDKLSRAIEIMYPINQPEMVVDAQRVDEMLYDSFVPGSDKPKMSVVRAANEDSLADLGLDFADERLDKLLTLYKARNYPKSLTPKEQQSWEKFKQFQLMSGGEKSRAAQYFARLSELAEQFKHDAQKQYLLEELQLYGQSVIPFEA